MMMNKTKLEMKILLKQWGGAFKIFLNSIVVICPIFFAQKCGLYSIYRWAKEKPFFTIWYWWVKASIYLGNIKNIKSLCEGSIKVAHCQKKSIELYDLLAMPTTKARIIVFRLIIEYNKLNGFWPILGNNNRSIFDMRLFERW
jgi:hypothetical protein